MDYDLRSRGNLGLGTKTEGTSLEGTVFGPTGVKIDIHRDGCDFLAFQVREPIRMKGQNSFDIFWGQFFDPLPQLTTPNESGSDSQHCFTPIMDCIIGMRHKEHKSIVCTPSMVSSYSASLVIGADGIDGPVHSLLANKVQVTLVGSEKHSSFLQLCESRFKCCYGAGNILPHSEHQHWSSQQSCAGIFSHERSQDGLSCECCYIRIWIS